MFKFFKNIFSGNKPLVFFSIYAPWMVLWEPRDSHKQMIQDPSRCEEDVESTKLNFLIFNNPDISKSYLEQCKNRKPNNNFRYIENLNYNHDLNNGLKNKIAFVDFPRVNLNLNSQEEILLKKDVSEWSLEYPVMILNSENFNAEIKNKNLYLVLFYAPWCPYCKQFRPIFMKTAAAVKAEKWECTLAALDCTKSPTIANVYNVDGYPTIYLFRGGKMVKEYKGSRTYEDLKTFIKRHLNATV